jgi:glycine hydroxymethyltransferase
MGFKVQAAELGFTATHQLAIDVSEFGGGDEVARHLKDNNIILNMNLLPFEPLDQVTNPAGVRLGVQEMTRFGMKEPEMGVIADLFKKCLMEGKYVGDEATKFRQGFRTIHYSFDHLKPA